MAGAALFERRVMWRIATVVALRDETSTARTLMLHVPDWPGHVAGQHLDVRVTAPDGYSAVRSYSIGSAPNSNDQIELTIERVPGGEVSPYLTQVVGVGDRLEVRGPVGGWFVWRTEQTEPIQLIAGGSGIVPIMSMIRSRVATQSNSPFRLLYSVREPDAAFYRDELGTLSDDGERVGVTFAYTRKTPSASLRPPGRIDAALIAEAAWPPALAPTCYVCGPTSFVESVTTLLGASGHRRDKIKTERFGFTGGPK